MKINLLFVLVLLTTNLLQSQDSRIIEDKALHFSLPHLADTIDFIIVGNEVKETEKKPLFLWCQGSLPLPLFGEIEKEDVFFYGGGIVNFDYQKIAKEYHLVVISMPKIPVVVEREHLNQQFQYVPDKTKPRQFSEAYLQSDYLEHYVERGLKVLRFLQKQKWVDAQKLVVAGHSQGTKVATKIALQSDKVTHLGLFAPNPFGRIDQSIRQARLDAQLGKISWPKADSLINSTYEFYKSVQDTSLYQNNPSLRAWKSFSVPYFEDWLMLDIPIYIAYGTEDRSADLCDIIPLFFIAAQKNNLSLKRYLNLEHNFFELDKNGRVNYELSHWKKVVDTFINWIK